MDDCSFQGHQSEHKSRDRILSNTSGNAQSFSIDAKGKIERTVTTLSGIESETKLQYPIPRTTLGSNIPVLDGDIALQEARRGNLSYILLDRKWMRHPKYLEYRNRKRVELGKEDGLPIWPNHIEDVFQDAIMYIPPMGRKKKARRGKSLGRNQLIEEYIFARTGARRKRKQISSHVQALGKIFQGMPEWTLATADLWPKSAKVRDYYSDSISDHVRIECGLMAETETKKTGNPISWTDIDLQTYDLHGLSFDLWIRSPKTGSQALHNYTRTPVNEILPSPSSLEGLKNWRFWFPDLDSILQSPGNSTFDIVNIKSSFALMTDLPPSNAQLVLQLELNFQNSLCENPQSLDALRYWSSTNHVYYDGHLHRKSEHKDYSPNGPGVIQPPFEVEWWAKQFAQLAEKRKDAEYDKDENAVASAEEYSRSLFRGLTVMQEIFTSTTPDQNPATRKRMAVLLWQFSQAGKTHTGITKLQKLIPPPSRTSMNSPSTSTIDSTLPPLNMDSIVDDDLITDSALDMFSESFNGSVARPASPPSYEVGDYYSGFTPMQIMSNGQGQTQLLDLPVEYYGTGFATDCGINEGGDIDCKAFDFSAPLPLPGTLSYLPSAPTPRNKQYSEVYDQGFDVKEADFTILHQLPNSDLFEKPIDRRQSIANFDINTHRLLQAQLEDYDANSSVCSYPQSQYQIDSDLQSQSNHQDVCLSFNSAPNSRSSVIYQMGDLGLDKDHINQSFDNNADNMLNEYDNIGQENIESTTIALENHPCVLDSPKVSRPPLMTHHSWAGITANTTENHDLLAFDTATRDDFAHLMISIEGMSQHGVGVETDMHADFLAGHNNWTSMPGQALPANLYRMHSQPVITWSEREHPAQRSMSIGNDECLENQIPNMCSESQPAKHKDDNDEEEWTKVKIEGDLKGLDCATISPYRIVTSERDESFSSTSKL